MALYELMAHFSISRTAVSKHLSILKEAGLVDSRKVGRETRYRLNAYPLKEISQWVSFYESFWTDRLLKLDSMLKNQINENREEQDMVADVKLDFHYEVPRTKVWEALTQSNLLSQWIMDNNFKAEVGYQFEFTAEANEWWDGIIQGEVLKVEEPSKLEYTWKSVGEETIVTWTLNETEDNQTNLHFEMSGFSEETKSSPGAIDGAIYSWTEFATKLTEVLEK